MTKKILFFLYIAVIVSMGAATIVEKYNGTGFTSEHIYGAWWFTLIWAMLAGFAIFHFVRSRVRKLSSVTLHLSFVIILLGALLTHLFSTRGMIHLRMGEPTSTYFVETNDAEGTEQRQLPFSIRMEKFEIKYHEGTASASDYETHFTVIDNGRESDGKVSMNNIYSHGGIRLYQSSYDEDMRGSILSINADPWGIPVTYTGYALLFISLVWMLIDPKGAFRGLLRNPMLKRGALVAILLFGFHCNSSHAATVLPKETAETFGELNILYNGRICPMQTFAIDFTKKLYGKASYKGYTAEQVLTGFIFWGDEWSNEPIIRIKDGALRGQLQLPAYCSVNTFFNKDMGGYILGPYLQECYGGNTDKFHKDVLNVDDRLMLIMELRRGTLLKMFPYTHEYSTKWYAPTENLPQTIPADNRHFIANIFSYLYQEIKSGHQESASEIIEKLKHYQEKYGAGSMPTPKQVRAERIYNSIPFATILFMVNLTLGFITLFIEIRGMTAGKDDKRNNTKASAPECRSAKSGKWMGRICLAVMMMSFAALTICEILRWIISGTIPMANGYETMLFVAWVVMLLSMIAYSVFRIALTFGFLTSGLFLLVSHISQMDPNISHVMPVLNSPLLSVHVSMIMISFALLAMTFICGITSMLIIGIRSLSSSRNTSTTGEQLASLQLLSRLFLYPALTTLGIGIFVGAIWANVSWGQYWGWDPKEVWALITFMVYAIAVHAQTLPALRKPLTFHVFMIMAFLTVIMTYFGVNYVLGGMHSYA